MKYQPGDLVRLRRGGQSMLCTVRAQSRHGHGYRVDDGDPLADPLEPAPDDWTWSEWVDGGTLTLVRRGEEMARLRAWLLDHEAAAGGGEDE